MFRELKNRLVWGRGEKKPHTFGVKRAVSKKKFRILETKIWTLLLLLGLLRRQSWGIAIRLFIHT